MVTWPRLLPRLQTPSWRPHSSAVRLSVQGQGQASDWCSLGKELPVRFLRWGGPQTREGGCDTGQPARQCDSWVNSRSWKAWQGGMQDWAGQVAVIAGCPGIQILTVPHDPRAPTPDTSVQLAEPTFWKGQRKEEQPLFCFHGEKCLGSFILWIYFFIGLLVLSMLSCGKVLYCDH